jgi:hypothetical protein
MMLAEALMRKHLPAGEWWERKHLPASEWVYPVDLWVGQIVERCVYVVNPANGWVQQAGVCV